MQKAIQRLNDEKNKDNNNTLKKYCLFLDKLQDENIIGDIYDESPIKYAIYDQYSAMNLIKQKGSFNSDLEGMNKLSELGKLLSHIKTYEDKYFVLKTLSGKVHFYNIDLEFLINIFIDLLNFIQCDRFPLYINNIRNTIIDNYFIIE